MHLVEILPSHTLLAGHCELAQGLACASVMCGPGPHSEDTSYSLSQQLLVCECERLERFLGVQSAFCLASQATGSMCQTFPFFNAACLIAGEGFVYSA